MEWLIIPALNISPWAVFEDIFITYGNLMSSIAINQLIEKGDYYDEFHLSLKKV